MSTDDAWTGPWIARKLSSHSEVHHAVAVTPTLVNIQRKTNRAIVVGTTSVESVSLDIVSALWGQDHSLSFVVNIPKDSYVTGEAIDFARWRRFAIGGFGDLLRALSIAEPGGYTRPEFSFVQRGLHQHSRVASFRQLADRKYLIERHALPAVSVVLLNEYELTGEHVRSALERFHHFSILLITNPNGRPTSNAQSVAASSGVEVLKWGEFLGRLNKP